MKRINKTKIEVFDEPMSSSYWRRHKKASVDLLRDTPIALDRQLEDQVQLMRQNRNPQAEVPIAGVDKLRSETIGMRKGAASAAAVKAKFVNKFVREASGVHNYAVIPQARASSDSAKPKVAFDPETHPLMKPYRQESNKKPIMCSFGHRPTSASRVFNPATMRVRMRHGETASAGSPGKCGFGLSVAVLSQILHAPPLHRPGVDDVPPPVETDSTEGTGLPDTSSFPSTTPLGTAVHAHAAGSDLFDASIHLGGDYLEGGGGGLSSVFDDAVQSSSQAQRNERRKKKKKHSTRLTELPPVDVFVLLCCAMKCCAHQSIL